jgi:predicted MPP superfamily phosphohydrolase
VSLVRHARPDLIVLTGDLLDHDARFARTLGRLVRELSALPARDGVTVIPGNHDYYAGVEEVLRTAREGGARVLRNQGRVIGDAGGAFALVGVDDVWAPRNGYGPGPDLDRALAMVPSDLPRILLCHNPSFFPAARGQVALQLSGHTHGGQVNLGVHPAELLLPYVEGLYVEGRSRLYVNRGFGTAGPPARVGAPPEVTLVVLTAA